MSAPRYSLRITLHKHIEGDVIIENTIDVSLDTRDMLDEWICLRMYLTMLRRLVITEVAP